MDRNIIFLNDACSSFFNRITRRKKSSTDVNGTSYQSCMFYITEKTLNFLIDSEIILKDTMGYLFLTTELNRITPEIIDIFKNGIQDQEEIQELVESLESVKENMFMLRDPLTKNNPLVIDGKELFIYKASLVNFLNNEKEIVEFVKEVMLTGKHLLLSISGISANVHLLSSGLGINNNGFITSSLISVVFKQTDVGFFYLDSITKDSTFFCIRKEGNDDLNYKSLIKEAYEYDPASKVHAIKISGIKRAITKTEELVNSLRETHKEHFEFLTKTYRDIVATDTHLESMRKSLESTDGTAEFFDSLIINKEIANIDFINNNLVITTKVLSAFSSETKRLHLIGQFYITISETGVTIRNLLGQIATHHAPHIRDSTICFGNIASDVSKCVAEKNYEELIPMLLLFLKSAKCSDGWGNKIKYFPLYPFQEDLLNRDSLISNGKLGAKGSASLNGFFHNDTFEQRMINIIRVQDSIPADIKPIKMWSEQ